MLRALPTSLDVAPIIPCRARHAARCASTCCDAGEEPSFPKHASSGARRDLKDASPVTLLCRHFCGGRAAPFADTLSQHEGALRDEGLLGLVRQMTERFASRAIRKLTSTFLTLSLTELAKQAGLPDAEAAKALVAKCALTSSVAEPCASGFVVIALRSTPWPACPLYQLVGLDNGLRKHTARNSSN